MRWALLLGTVVVLIGGLLSYNYLTIFVVQPIGAMPQGAGVVVWRKSNTKFIDSPDALCDRTTGGVSLLCRGMAVKAVMEDNKVLFRIGYSEWLYDISTGGKRWDR